jgi:HlyD family secretion protein
MILAIFLLVAGAVTLGVVYYQANPGDWDSFLAEMKGESSAGSEPRPVKRTSRNDDALEASGTIEVNEITISTLMGGKVTDVYVEEGQKVAKGDLLLRYDDRSLQAQRDVLMANVDQAEAALAGAQAQLDRAYAGPTSEEIAAAEGAVQAAFGQLNLAKAGLNGLKAAIALGQTPSTPTDYDLAGAEAQVETAEGQLGQAQALLVLVSTGATEYDKALLQFQVDQAAAALEAAEAALRVIEIQIEDASVYAPIDGFVLQRLTNPGELAAPTAALFLLADLEELTLTVYVPEADLGQVALDQKADVSVDAYDETFPGRVYHIASTAEFTPRNVQTQEERVHMVFSVKIRLDNSRGLLKPGLPADAVFANLSFENSGE